MGNVATLDTEAKLWAQRIDGYIGDPDGKFSATDLQDPFVFTRHVAEAYGVRRPRSDSALGHTVLNEVRAVTEALNG